jgi:AcrR family transcriptional regulator
VPPRRSSAAKAAAAPAGASARGGGPAQERELRAQGRKTMRKLLDAGMAVFEKRGYHAARVDDVVKLAKTSHGTFYLYFANKEDLFRALLGDVAGELNDLSESLGEIGPDADGYRELHEWLGRFLDIYDRYGAVIRAWTEAEMGDTELGRMGDAVLTGFNRAVVDRIRHNSAQSGVNPQLAAMALVAMVERFTYYVHSRRTKAERDEILDTLTGIIHVGFFGGTRSDALKATPAKAKARTRARTA